MPIIVLSPNVSKDLLKILANVSGQRDILLWMIISRRSIAVPSRELLYLINLHQLVDAVDKKLQCQLILMILRTLEMKKKTRSFRQKLPKNIQKEKKKMSWKRKK